MIFVSLLLCLLQIEIRRDDQLTTPLRGWHHPLLIIFQIKKVSRNQINAVVQTMDHNLVTDKKRS
jgi:hypothetical protein